MTAAETLGGFRVAYKRCADSSVPVRRIDSSNASIGCGWMRAIRAGEALTLPPWQRWTVVSGRVWLTHEDDSRDSFPKAGARFESRRRSVVEAMEDAVLQLG